ncbi:flagellar protein export ATPase FliI [Mesoaciditoga lauensis]|uniref:flagellar protein export ATPase FliI n=1 Tax=Mesoaciditoga lauensis TaxID=1495039 RepID=UPI00055C32D6
MEIIKDMLNKIKNDVEDGALWSVMGRIDKVVGLTIESIGPNAPLGELCEIESTYGKVLAEIVGFKENKVILMPLSDTEGLSIGASIRATGERLSVPVGSSVLGRVIDGLGMPLDGRPLPLYDSYPLNAPPPNPIKRKMIKTPLPVGVRAIDAFLTIGKGQRIGIFSGSGVGKSTLMGMIARNAKSDVNVICLVGERGREVREFIERDLGSGIERSVVVVATSDKPALVRVKAIFTATAIAEYFRDQGKNVLLMVDSLTRFALAQREVGLAVGEPPATRGYTPSVFALFPKILERAGNSDKGSITGIYTVLVEGDDINEPISDTARGILDGHIVLTRDLANANHYPAIDVLKSVSRVMPSVVDKEIVQSAMTLRDLMSTYNSVKDMISVGAYKKGTDPKIDRSIEMHDKIENFLKQAVDDPAPFEETLEMLKKLAQEAKS